MLYTVQYIRMYIYVCLGFVFTRGTWYVASECPELAIQWVGYLLQICRLYILAKLIVQNIHVFRTVSLDENQESIMNCIPIEQKQFLVGLVLIIYTK